MVVGLGLKAMKEVRKVHRSKQKRRKLTRRVRARLRVCASTVLKKTVYDSLVILFQKC